MKDYKAMYEKQVRWINDILFRFDRMQDATTSQALRFLHTVREELDMMVPTMFELEME